MPSRNTIKAYEMNSFYHVYNRGAAGQNVFKDAQDKQKFLSLIDRYLTPINKRTDENKHYPEYDIEINAYCMMGNHFHLLVYLLDDVSALSGLLRSASTAYSMYFNKKYKNRGHVFQGIFKASQITDEDYLEHITRYIHMNPRTYKTYKWSSVSAYTGGSSPKWLRPERSTFMEPNDYSNFLQEYEGRKKELESLKSQLAE